MLNSIKSNSTSLSLIAKSILKQRAAKGGDRQSIIGYVLSKNVSLSSASNSNSSSSNNEEKLAKTEFGLLFDIDGVLVRGKTLLPKTRECIKMITDSNGNFIVPTVFLTNAGNELRSSKSGKLSNLLGVYVDPSQVVMSHSPLKLFKNFHDKRCLISGQGPIIEIAKNLGFKSLITIDDLRQYYPHLDVVDHKRRNFAPCVLGRYFPPIEAIVLFGESIRWETNLQLIVDVLMCNGKLDQTAVHKFPLDNLPILACNTDMVWMAEAPMPRFGHGTFLHCLEQIYQKLSGKELKYTAIVGKPCEITYFYAERMIQNHAESIGIKHKIKRLYAIGDNLDTDIYGANMYNQILENNRRYREKLESKAHQQQQQKSKQAVAAANRSERGGAQLIEHEETTATVTATSSQVVASSEVSNQVSSPFVSSSLSPKSGVNDSYVSETESISSILVKTGVFRGDVTDINDHTVDLALSHKDMIVDPSLIKPNFICENAYDAVKLVYQREKY